ncbi:efflux pump [Hyaloscypha variabilis F]|uniref:Efflux pump n=1 Tax=Hyaloscypha variabilis (strain UAMH 11265 / GT02V1 / F) TaxID=1149755 RepID=A0A2J6RH06_HYAVF|nr:efflux pump [Hyaloscypha variabilis F]
MSESAAPHRTTIIPEQRHNQNSIANEEPASEEISTMKPQDIETSNPYGEPVSKKTQIPPKQIQAPASALKLYLLFPAVCFSTFLFSLNAAVVATAVPRITDEFNSLSDIGWYGSAFALTTCCVQPLTGKIYTFFPTKYSFMTFQAIFMVGSLVAGIASSSKMLIVGRAVQGIGGSGLLTGAFNIIAAIATPEKRPMLVGIAMGMTMIGSVIGPVIGGALTTNVSWRWCFYINLPPAGLSILIIFALSIPEQMPKKPVLENWRHIISEMDFLGFTLFAPAVTMFLIAIMWGGNQHAWNSSTIIGLLVGSVVTAAIFTVWQIHLGDRALIPPKVMKNRLVWSGCLNSAFLMGSLVLLAYYLPLWFQIVKGVNATLSGVMTLPIVVSQSVGAVIAGKLVEKVGYIAPFALFGSMLVAIGSGLITTFLPNTGAGQWVGYQLLAGIGRASVMQMPMTAVQFFLPANEISIATAEIFFFQYFGATLFVAVGETIFEQTLVPSLLKYAPSIDPELVIHSGGTTLRSIVSPEELPGVLRAYDAAITNTFYLGVAGACATFLSSFWLGWEKIGSKKRNEMEVKTEEPLSRVATAT